MAIVTWRGDGTGNFYQDVGVAEGESYSYTLWACRDGGALTGSFYMGIEWYSGDTLLGQDERIMNLPDDWS